MDTIEGNGVTLLIGIGVTLWAGLGIVKVAQDAVNNMWAVSIMRRPGFFPKLIRSLGVLFVIGFGFILAAVVSGATYFIDLPGLQQVLGTLLALGVNAAILLVSGMGMITSISIPGRSRLILRASASP